MNKIFRLCLGLVLAAVLTTLTWIPLTYAQQPGDLDTTFGYGGLVTTTIGNGDDYGHAVALQSDGKIIVAGKSSNGRDNDFALVRYTITGSLDTTFGRSGVVTTTLGHSDDYAKAVALQSDGKIIVVGESWGRDNDFALVRYTITGSLDTTFGCSGVVTTAIGQSDDYAEALALQSDGKSVVVGENSNGSTYDFALARYTITGSLDSTFGRGGIVTTPIGSASNIGAAVVIQPDGKIVVAGDSPSSSIYDFVLVRYTVTGSLDTTFGMGGVVTTSIGHSDDSVAAVALQSDGQIVVAGYSWNHSAYDFVLARYTITGSLDTTFGVGGVVTTDFNRGNDDVGMAVALQSDGKIIVAGTCTYLVAGSSTYDFALVRYNSDGSLDTTFDTDGKVTTDFSHSFDFGSAIALQPDGKLVVAGYSGNGNSSNDFAVARYEGSLLERGVLGNDR